jgi:hypothetical protein
MPGQRPREAVQGHHPPAPLCLSQPLPSVPACEAVSVSTYIICRFLFMKLHPPKPLCGIAHHPANLLPQAPHCSVLLCALYYRVCTTATVVLCISLLCSSLCYVVHCALYYRVCTTASVVLCSAQLCRSLCYVVLCALQCSVLCTAESVLQSL